MIETKEWRTIDKSEWGPGPWQDEPDKRQWTDPATELPCLINRHPEWGHWCGYVGVPRGHPWYEIDAEEISAEAHGGLNFSAKCTGDETSGVCHLVALGEDDDVWWLGFDCGHWLDKQPGYETYVRKISDHLVVDGDERVGFSYRHLAYVIAEVTNLARQANEARALPPPAPKTSVDPFEALRNLPPPGSE